MSFNRVAGILSLLASTTLFAQSATPTLPGTQTGKITTSPPGPSSPTDGKKKAPPHKPDKAKHDEATIEKIPPANPANH